MLCAGPRQGTTESNLQYCRKYSWLQLFCHYICLQRYIMKSNCTTSTNGSLGLPSHTLPMHQGKITRKWVFCLSPLLCPCVSMPITRGLECTEFYVGSLIQSHVVGSIRRDESFSTSWRNMSRLSTVKSWRKHFVAGVAFPCPGFFNAVGASTLQQFEFV